MKFQPDPVGEAARGGGFYVSVIDGRRHALALGPFETHAEAKANVQRVRDYLYERAPAGTFWVYGTARLHDPEGQGFPEGRLNAELGVSA